MVRTLVEKKIALFKKQSEDIKIILGYRNVSLIITSFFYFVGNSQHTIERKIFIVACIALSSIILQYLYIKVHSSNSKVALLIMIEIIGNTVLLIPSGGIDSPYIWYSLNTILMISIRLNHLLCWGNLSIYFFAFIKVMQLGEGSRNNTLLSIVNEQRNLVLSLILITLAMQILGKYLRQIHIDKVELGKTNERLMNSNYQIKETIDYIMELYQTVEVLTTEKDKSGLIHLMMDYTEKITKAKTIMFYQLPKQKTSFIMKSKQIDLQLEERIQREISRKWSIIISSKIPIKVDIDNRKFFFTSLQSNQRVYGVLVLELQEDKNTFIHSTYTEQLSFLSNLSSIVLERLELEEVNERLLINEEQNRIADEIHDKVLQRLFSASCALFAMMKSSKRSVEEIKQELNLVRSAINNGMKDLRSTIYGMSWKKEGANNFEVDLKNYIREIKKLSNIAISLDIKGDHELLSYQQKRSLYRIICEGIGNGVRHGQATEIQIVLDVGIHEIDLTIKDNGKGFEYKGMEAKNSQGLGLKNIHYLTHYLKGKVTIKSNIGKGTEINITLPHNKEEFIKEEVV